MNKKKFAIIFGAIVVAAVAAAVIWYFFGDGRHDSKDRVYVEKVSVIMGTATGAQNRYSGVVQPQKSVEINADSERTVKEVLVKVGDTVEEGTPLFNYDTDDLNTKRAEIETIYTSSDKELVKELLDKYDISYIFVGSCEREKYGTNLNEEILAGLGKKVFQSENSDTYILKVN